MDILPQEVISIRGEDDIVLARQRAREIATAVGFGIVDQSRIATAVSELARNVVRYATGGQGRVEIRMLEGAVGSLMEIIVADDGPGIEDVERAMTSGLTTGRGLGMGLSGTRRLMDEMIIESGSGRGTSITIRKRLR